MTGKGCTFLEVPPPDPTRDKLIFPPETGFKGVKTPSWRRYQRVTPVSGSTHQFSDAAAANCLGEEES
jgi:hypothetical protein